MIARLLIPLSLAALPCAAEPFSNTGYALGCDASGCTVYSAGFLMQVANDGSTPARIIAKLATMPDLTPVRLKGDLGALGDATARLTLTGLSVLKDDRYAETLRRIQGQWRQKGGKDTMQINGLQWQAADGASFLIAPGDSCADGKTPGGTTLSLSPMGGDPSEAACWQVAQVSDSELHLRDAKSAVDPVIYDRVQP
jgi:hypothetical protein